MDRNVKFLLWNMMGDDESDRDVLEHNGLELQLLKTLVYHTLQYAESSQ